MDDVRKSHSGVRLSRAGKRCVLILKKAWFERDRKKNFFAKRIGTLKKSSGVLPWKVGYSTRGNIKYNNPVM